MSMNRALALSRQALRVAMTALCMLPLAACVDGYPTEDVEQIDPARMSQQQLLVALNALGKEPQLGKRWRYALHANCELQVSLRDGNTDQRRVVLEGAQVTVRSLEGVSEIRLAPKAGGEAQAVTVLETRTWADTIRARSLLTHLEVRCGNRVVPGA
jgi:hypothetical protein